MMSCARLLRQLGVATACALLSACAAWSPRVDLPSRTLPVQWPARAAALAEWDRYSLRARVSAVRGAEVVTARLVWSQNGALSRLNLTSPLGIGGLELTVTEDIEQRLNDALGFEVPVKSLRYWLLGIPDPSWPVAGLSPMDEWDLGLPRSFQQQGWQIGLQRYTSVPGTSLRMPSLLEMRHDAVQLKIFIESWGTATLAAPTVGGSTRGGSK